VQIKAGEGLLCPRDQGGRAALHEREKPRGTPTLTIAQLTKVEKAVPQRAERMATRLHNKSQSAIRTTGQAWEESELPRSASLTSNSPAHNNAPVRQPAPGKRMCCRAN
jgi:hypothetical protein